MPSAAVGQVKVEAGPGRLEFNLHPIKSNFCSREDRQCMLEFRFTSFWTQSAQVNQYQAANLGFSSQLSDRCDVAVTNPPGEFRIIV